MDGDALLIASVTLAQALVKLPSLPKVDVPGKAGVDLESQEPGPASPTVRVHSNVFDYPWDAAAELPIHLPCSQMDWALQLLSNQWTGLCIA